MASIFTIPFRGGRIIKTGIAVFLTAWICELLQWPAVFAVITAIVTIEPTVTDSIKKGLIRFPASAIGSLYTVSLVFILGHTPLTYTLAAVLTIATCYKLNLHAGLLVATLTAVAMVDAVHSNFFIAFAVRLGTTSIGLLVSTAVNMLIFPPEYTQNIATHITQLRQNLSTLLPAVFRHITQADNLLHSADQKLFANLQQELAQTKVLLHFQEKDLHQPLAARSKYPLAPQKNELQALYKIATHLENIMQLPPQTLQWSHTQQEELRQTVQLLADSIAQTTPPNYAEQQAKLTHLQQQFSCSTALPATTNSLPTETIILYELIAMYEQLQSL